nr:MAG TPA: hypothetical protein [Caudoviricetes sp.]
MQCSTFESGDESSPNNLAAGIFMSEASLLYRIVPSRVEC